MNINIKTFSKKFSNEYEFLYDNHDNVAGFRDAVIAFDEFALKHRDFVDEFARYRRDYITSDREAAAFMFTLYDMID